MQKNTNNDLIISSSVAKKVQDEINKANPKKGKIAAYVEADMLAKFKKKCKQKNLKMSNVIEQLMTIFVNG